MTRMSAAAALPATRLVSLDAFRGFVMLLMAAELMELPEVASHFPDSAFWRLIARHTQHVEWTGCSLHDLIQPAFSFMVGVAVPFSIASRMARGQGKGVMALHALWRAALLVLLGVFLRSMGEPMTYWTFEDTLSQIGLGYPLLFLLGFAGGRTRWTALALLLVGYWLAFACFKLPPLDFNHTAANVPLGWPHHFEGFLAHWNMNSNAAWAFDVWFLNLFTRAVAFAGNDGGYSTLSFIPTLGTMVLGLIAGTWLRETCANPMEKTAEAVEKAVAGEELDAAQSTALAAGKAASRLIYAGLACLALGWLLHVTGTCPVVKKLWTPAWTLYSGGWCFLLMATFYFVVDMQGWKRWTFPLVVVGMNSIAMYVLAHTVTDFFGEALHTHFGKKPFLLLGEVFEPLLHGGAVLLILWLILLWMHRRKLWLRI
jgi:heparan-alpha-glucosaminide N-acetyltransferase